MTDQQVSVLEVVLKMLLDLHDWHDKDKEYQPIIAQNWGGGHPRNVSIVALRDAIARRGYFAEKPEA
jgi:hypothetical protein